MPDFNFTTPGYDGSTDFYFGATAGLVPTEFAWQMYAPRAVVISDPESWAWQIGDHRAVIISDPKSWAWESYAPGIPVTVEIPAENWAWSLYAPRSVIISGPDPWAWKSIAPASQWALPAATPYRDIYICTLRLTGLADVEVPMSSLQLRRRDGNPTMVQVIVPDALTYLAYAQDREGGEIIIQAGKLTAGGTRHLSELERASLDTIKYDRGVRSSSLTIEGYRTETNSNPRPVDISGVIYEGLQSDGKQRFRSSVDIFLRPGDTAIFLSSSITVDQIYIKVEAANSWMEVAGI